MTKNYKVFLLMVLILILAGALRLIQIKNAPPGLYPDEAMNGNNALEALRTTPPDGGFKVFYPENNGREGLFINIQALFLKVLIPKDGVPEPWMLRLASAIFGILTVLGIYFLIKELLHNPTIALLSSFLIATSFWHINFSRIGFRAIMAPAFLVWGIFLLLKALNQTKNKPQITNYPDGKAIEDSRQSRNKLQTNPDDQSPKSKSFWNLYFEIWILPALAGLVYGLGFYSYIAYRVTPLLIFVILWFYFKKNKRNGSLKKFWLSTFCFLISALIVVLPLAFYFMNNPQDFFGRTAQISIFSAQGGSASGGDSLTVLKNLGFNAIKTLGMFNFSGDWNWRHNIAGAPLLFWPVGIMFLIGIATAIKNIIQKSKIKNQNDNLKIKNNLPRADTEILHFAFCILISWLVTAALPVIISNEGLPHALRSILMAPAVFIIAAIGAVKTYQWFSEKKVVAKSILTLGSFLFILALIAEAYNAYFIRWARNPETQNAFAQNYVSMAKEINALPKEIPKYVVVEASGADVRGIPMPAQTVMFITDTFLADGQKQKNVFYVLPDQKDKIPEGSIVFTLN